MIWEDSGGKVDAFNRDWSLEVLWLALEDSLKRRILILKLSWGIGCVWVRETNVLTISYANACFLMFTSRYMIPNHLKVQPRMETTLSVPFFFPNLTFSFFMPPTRTRNCLIITFEWFLSKNRNFCLSEFLQHQIFSWNAQGSAVFDRDYSLYIWNAFYVNSWSILFSQEPESPKRIKSSTAFCK